MKIVINQPIDAGIMLGLPSPLDSGSIVTEGTASRSDIIRYWVSQVSEQV